MHIQNNIQQNIPLKPYNSFRTQALAKLFCEPKSVEELVDIIKNNPNETGSWWWIQYILHRRL